jgi:adenosylmethionine-8-amino-7-oxononanoate aminotransferase
LSLHRSCRKCGSVSTRLTAYTHRSRSARDRARFSAEESNRLLRDFLSPRLFDLGLICRAEDKGEPVIQLSPPLVAGPEEFREIAWILRQALGEACDRMS